MYPNQIWTWDILKPSQAPPGGLHFSISLRLSPAPCDRNSFWTPSVISFFWSLPTVCGLRCGLKCRLTSKLRVSPSDLALCSPQWTCIASPHCRHHPKLLGNLQLHSNKYLRCLSSLTWGTCPPGVDNPPFSDLVPWSLTKRCCSCS